MQQETLVSIEQLSLVYHSLEQTHKALDKVSLKLSVGKSMGLVGESGSGKSTIAHALLGLLPTQAKIESGSIRAMGHDLLSNHSKAQAQLRGRDISMIFQDPMSSLTPHMTIEKQMIEPLIMVQKLTLQEARLKALELLEDVEISNPELVLKRYPHECSGGMCQRIMIAIALSAKPQLLVADEPTTALDVTTQATILKIIKDLQHKHNMALLFVSHDLGVIKEVCDEISVMHQGKIIEQGACRDILHSPQKDYTKNLIAAIPKLKGPKPDYLPNPQNHPLSDKPALKSEEVLLNIKDLSVEYPSQSLFGVSEPFKAVKQVSFSLNEGSILGIVGESGSGKSTTAKAIAGLINSSTGTITFQNQLLKGIHPDIQMIFQDPAASLNPRMTVGRNISEPLIHIKGTQPIHEKVIELLKCVDLTPEYYHRYPHELSGGQQQRIGIARALASNPKLIICDEPVSALDVSIQAQVLNLLKHLQRTFNLSLLFITHDISVVRFIADEIIVMKTGEIVERGETESLLNNPNHHYTKELLSAVPQMDL